MLGIRKLKDMFCYVYHERECGKDPNEVISLLNNYIEAFILCDPYIKKLRIFADTCACQNKKFAIVSFVMSLVELLYPVRGHSSMHLFDVSL